MLVDRYTNRYIETQNALHGVHDVYVFVEAETDREFWQTFLAPIQQDSDITFKIRLTERAGKVIKGKSSIFAVHKPDTLGHVKLIACDADYDLLVPDGNPYSSDILSSPYIITTYCHNLESYKCESWQLPGYIEKATKVSAISTDPNDLIIKFSKAISPLLVLMLASKDVCDTEFKESDMAGVVSKLNKNNVDKWTTVINTELTRHQTFITENKEKLEYYENKLQSIDISPDLRYMFINGHTLRGFVKRLLVKIVQPIYRQRVNALCAARDFEGRDAYEQAVLGHCKNIDARIDELLDAATPSPRNRYYQRVLDKAVAAVQ